MSSGKVAIISQARIGSTRLPSKVLLPVKGKVLLAYHYERLLQSGLPVIIATTVRSEDDQIAAFCEERNIAFSRGSEDDVLSRYLECARKFELDTIVRVTSDCPLIDGYSVGQAVKEYEKFDNKQLYYSNTLERTFPRGFDLEIFSRELLEEAGAKAVLASDREHVTPFIWNNRTGDVIIRQFRADRDTSGYRITVDTKEDFELIRQLIEVYQADSLSAADIIQLLDTHPELKEINAHIEQKKIQP
jgi:spore coat polysaccharide biosynthesis protein SpsF